MMATQPKQALIDQLDAERKTVAFDAYDIIVRQLVDMVENKEIDIAPDYQRQFVWDEPRESELIESLLLGIPVPSLYMAVNPSDGVWEVVDGVQRLSTILHFRGIPQHLKKIRKTNPLELQGLSKLSEFNGLNFDDLPVPIKTGFLNRSLRVTVLNDRSDTSVRFDLFERLNTGGVGLHAQEIRNIVYRGNFKNAIQELSHSTDLRSFLKLPKKGRNSEASADYEEAVLRFFAFKDNYEAFDHSVKDFLNDYMHSRANTEMSDGEKSLFEETFAYLHHEFPDGLTRGRNATPINLFEGVAVGTALARESGRALSPNGPLPALVQNSADLKRFTSAGTNSRLMVRGRIEIVRDAL